MSFDRKAWMAAYGRVYRKKHAARYKRLRQEWYRTHKAEAAALNKRYTSSPKGIAKRRDRDYQKTYGLTLFGVRLLLKQQGGKCAICGQMLVVEGGKPNSCHVDHNHATGEFRGLLCNKCNRGIGLLRDSPALLRQAVAYLAEGESDAITQANRHRDDQARSEDCATAENQADDETQHLRHAQKGA